MAKTLKQSSPALHEKTRTKLGSFLELTQKAENHRDAASNNCEKRKSRRQASVRNSTHRSTGGSDTSETSFDSATNYDSTVSSPSVPMTPDQSERRRYKRRGSCTKSTLEEDSNHVRTLTPNCTNEVSQTNDGDKRSSGPVSPGTPVKAGRPRISLRRNANNAKSSSSSQENDKNSNRSTKIPQKGESTSGSATPRKKVLNISLAKKRESPASQKPKKVSEPKKISSVSSSPFQYPEPFKFKEEDLAQQPDGPQRDMSDRPESISSTVNHGKRSQSMAAAGGLQRRRTIDELPIPMSPIKRGSSPSAAPRVQNRQSRHNRESSSGGNSRHPRTPTSEPKRVHSAPSRVIVDSSPTTFKYPTPFDFDVGTPQKRSPRAPPQASSCTANTNPTYVIDERPIQLRNSTHKRQLDDDSAHSFSTIDQLPIPMKNSSHHRSTSINSTHPRSSSHNDNNDANKQWLDDCDIRSESSFHEDEDFPNRSGAIIEPKPPLPSRNTNMTSLPPLQNTSSSSARTQSINRTKFHHSSPTARRQPAPLPPRVPGPSNLGTPTKHNDDKRSAPVTPSSPTNEFSAAEEVGSNTSSPLPPPPLFSVDDDDEDDIVSSQEDDDIITTPQKQSPRKIVSLSSKSEKKRVSEKTERISSRGGERRVSSDNSKSPRKSSSLPSQLPFDGHGSGASSIMMASSSSFHTENIIKNNRRSRHRRISAAGDTASSGDNQKRRRKPPSVLPSDIPSLSSSPSAGTTTRNKRRLSLTSFRKGQQQQRSPSTPPSDDGSNKNSKENGGWRSPLSEGRKRLPQQKPDENGWVSPFTGKSHYSDKELSSPFDKSHPRSSSSPSSIHHCSTPSPAKHKRKLKLRCPPTR